MKNNLKIIKNNLTDECKKLFKKINDDYEKRFNLNTFVSSCMEILNNIKGTF
jgi:Leucyl-tRNA synthetase